MPGVHILCALISQGKTQYVLITWEAVWSKVSQISEEKLFRGKINKMKETLDSWKQRNLTTYDKMTVCNVPRKIVREVKTFNRPIPISMEWKTA